MSTKKIIYIDMDDTLCQLSNELTKVRSERGIEFPHAIPEFWLDLPPITNAITSVNKLKADPDFDVYVLTAPSLRNPRSYMEKRLWIEKHFGYEFCEKLIICSNKGLLRGDYLIDDYDEGKGQENFVGELLHFGSAQYPSWQAIMEKLALI